MLRYFFCCFMEFEIIFLNAPGNYYLLRKKLYEKMGEMSKFLVNLLIHKLFQALCN